MNGDFTFQVIINVFCVIIDYNRKFRSLIISKETKDPNNFCCGILFL